MDSPEGLINYEYDDATGRLERTWTPYTDTRYTYDELGRLKTVAAHELNDVVQATPLVTTYDYDAAGNLDRRSLPNGIVSDYDYDPLNRLDLLTVTRGSTVVFSQDYVLLDNGQRDSVVETREGGGVVRIDWAYDALDRLVGEARDVGDDGPGAGDYGHAYVLDLVGNRLTKTIDDGDDGSADETVTSSYNANDWLLAEDSTVPANSASHTYDANGSTTTTTRNGQITRYAWDLRNRMVGIDANNDGDTSDPGDATYVYDDANQRVSQTADGTIRRFLNDKLSPMGYPQILEEWVGPSAQSLALARSYIVGLQVEGQHDSTNGTLALVRDGHGSVRGVADAAGLMVEPYDYQAFGEAIGFDASSALTIHLFGGDAEYDPSSAFYYHDARWRRTHTFVSLDSYMGRIRDPSTLHKYRYTNADPVNRADPSGLYEIDFHYYAVYYLLRARGFGRATADSIASFSQYVDENEQTNPLNLGRWTLARIPGAADRLRDFHFFGSSSDGDTVRDDPQARAALQGAFAPYAGAGRAPTMDDDILIGRWLHTYADTWAHEGYSAYPGHGHLFDMHEPDEPWRDVDRALQAAQRIYSVIPAQPGAQVVPWEELEDDLRSAFTTPHKRVKVSFRTGATWMRLPYTSGERIAAMQAVIRQRFGEEVSYDPNYGASNSARFTATLGLARLGLPVRSKGFLDYFNEFQMWRGFAG